ncbi:MFS transporter [Streptococcus suis]|uniref:MFS transporter n=1 Tax=Streptococcus suis TaxID=1307 RepID=UPI000424BEB9|nr:MFS transporter [Streptococcus suis]HEM3208123.1 MFS transporter [Streptococcus suis 4417]
MKTLKKIVHLLLIRLIINFADSLFYIATIWNISDQPNSTFKLGVIVALFTVPEVILFIFGPLIDRMNPRKLIGTSIATQVVILSVMVYFNILDFSIGLLVLIFISEIMSSLTYPLEDILLPRFVDKNEIIFANSIFAISYKVLDFIFNAFAGGLLIYFTISQLYQLNILVFALAFLPLLQLKVSKWHETEEELELNYFKELKEGVAYIWKGEYILSLTIPLIFINFAVAVNIVAYPYYIRQFSQPELLLTLFSLVAGVGSLLGNSLVTKITQKMGIGKIIILFLSLNGIVWGLAFSIHNEWSMLGLLLLSYICSSIYNVVYETLFQVLVPKRLLGRVNTLVDSLVTLAMPLGALVGGWILMYVPINIVMLLFSVSLFITSMYYYSNKTIYKLPRMHEIDEEE